MREWNTLTSLSLNHNHLSTWDTVDALSQQLPSLRELRLQHNPLVVVGSSNSTLRGYLSLRQALIARISTLCTLNGSTISEKERSEAEKAYLRHCVLTAENGQVNVSQHPRFPNLVALYGMPTVSGQESSGSSQSTLAVDVIPLTLRYLNESVVKNLPRTLTISNLKTLFRRLFKLNSPVLHLVAVLEPHTLPVPLDDDLSSLQDYGLRSNSEIIAHEN
jgi:hypothetical protein